MFLDYTSSIMRTTLDLSDPVLRDLKRMREREGGSLGSLASRLLAEALAAAKRTQPRDTKLTWSSQPMGAKVNLADKDAVYRAMEGR